MQGIGISDIGVHDEEEMWLLVVAFCVTCTMTVSLGLAQDEYSDDYVTDGEAYDDYSYEVRPFVIFDEDPWPVENREEPAPAPMGNVVSLSTLKAPKKALGAYEKARAYLERGKLPKAMKYLQEAVGIYPDFALAWYGLGLIHHLDGRLLEARDALERSVAADPRYWKPYGLLADIALQSADWTDALNVTQHALRTVADPSPTLHLQHAIATLGLGKLEDAEASVRRVIRLDEGRELPRAFYVLGLILLDRQDLAGAREQFLAYLEHEPDAPEADLVRREVAEIDRRTGAGAVATIPQNRIEN